ncbi:Os07g0560100 [Oryza sativa Japonica Group]|uniref:Os07g0560100 protein n=1 Tax=Oryza sativa subsp. japonica TaxID=39947 RepID=A0A0P0X7P4_ORYSJ|nr:Os07g0560100 [Oryza sativa Japonica Group]
MASTVALKGRPLATLLKQLLADAPSAATGRPVATPAAYGRSAPPPPEGAPLRRRRRVRHRQRRGVRRHRRRRVRPKDPIVQTRHLSPKGN